MSIYRRQYSYRTADGRKVTKRAERYTIAVHGPDGRLHRFQGPKDKKAAKVAEADKIRQLERREHDLEDQYGDHRAVPTQKFIDGFIENLKARKADEMYIYTARKRLGRMALEVPWKNLFEVSKAKFEKWRAGFSEKGWNGRPTKGKTLNQYLAIANEFLDWCVSSGFMPENPIAKVQKSKEIVNDNYRRAATTEEIANFLPALPSDDLRRFYIFLAYTALRRGSLSRLRWENLKLDGADAYVEVKGDFNKPGITQRFALRKDVADLMKAAQGDRPPAGLVFDSIPTMKEHKAYLAKAGIPFDDGKGNKRLDLHAFRRTLHTWMEDAGVDVREASKALGHLHLSTTMKNYRERRDGKAVAGVEKLPTLIGKGDAVN